MPYTADPGNVPADTVRFLVGDTDVNDELLADAEVTFLLEDQGGNIRRAAARAAESLAARFAKHPSEKKVGPLMIMYGTRAVTISDAYMKLAKLLWAQASASAVGPYAGGISVVDKVTNAENTDRVRPAFARRMMRYPNGDTKTVGLPSEILSPPQEIP